jgi:hypothetical protein
MKYSEAEKQIKALSSKYSTDMIGEYFNVNYKGAEVAYVSTKKQYFTRVWFEDRFKQMPLSNKIYMILSEIAITPLDERVEAKKYQVRAFGKYLNLNVITSDIFLSDNTNTEHFKAEFTIKEIEQLKQREDIPLDWNKVTLVEAD